MNSPPACDAPTRKFAHWRNRTGSPSRPVQKKREDRRRVSASPTIGAILARADLSYLAKVRAELPALKHCRLSLVLLNYLALLEANVLADLHLYENGNRSCPLTRTNPVLSSWMPRQADWLRMCRLLKITSNKNAPHSLYGAKRKKFQQQVCSRR